LAKTLLSKVVRESGARIGSSRAATARESFPFRRPKSRELTLTNLLGGAGMLATLGMLFAVGGIVWIIIVVIVVLVLIGVFARGR